MNHDGWFYERSFNNNFSMGWKVKSILHSEQSEFQKIDVLDTYAVGKLLLLEGRAQCTVLLLCFVDRVIEFCVVVFEKL